MYHKLLQNYHKIIPISQNTVNHHQITTKASPNHHKISQNYNRILTKISQNHKIIMKLPQNHN